MKSIMIVLLTVAVFSINGFAQTSTSAPSAESLIGSWKIDMTPEDETDSNFAEMEITKATDNVLKGTFYSKEIRFRNGITRTQNGRLYGALVSGDGSGDYNTTFYYENGKLYGTTHSLGRNFLTVWTASKLD